MSGKNNKSDIEVDEIKVILEQLQDLKVSPPEKNADTPPANQTESQKNSGIALPAISLLLLITAGSAAAYHHYSNNTSDNVEKTEAKKEPVEQTEPEIKQVKPEIKKVEAVKPPEEKIEKPALSTELKNLLNEASALIQQGKILSARELLNIGFAKAPEAAQIPFMLAQTYDPSFLKTLPASDADAELGEAEKWYREWDKVASSTGSRKPDTTLNEVLNNLR